MTEEIIGLTQTEEVLEPLIYGTILFADPTPKTVVCQASDNRGRSLEDFKNEEDPECFDN